MPQVVMGEGNEAKGESWSCGDCAAEGKTFTDEEAKVILHSVKIHGAHDVIRDTANKIVRGQSKA